MILVEAERPLTPAEINSRLAQHHPELMEFVGNVPTTSGDLWTLLRARMPVKLVRVKGEGEYEEIPTDVLLHDDTSKRGRLRGTRWALRDSTPDELARTAGKLVPSASDLAVVSVLRGLLQDGIPGSFKLWKRLEAALAALQSRLPKMQEGPFNAKQAAVFRTAAKHYLGRQVPPKTIRLAAEAMEKMKPLEGTYVFDEKKERKIQALPVGFYLSGGKSYMVGARCDTGDLRVYRLDRFQNLKVRCDLDPPVYSRQEAKKLLETHFGGFAATPYPIKLRIDPVIAYLFRDYTFHPSQKVKKNTDGSLDVTLESPLGFTLEKWIMGMGEHAEVLEPQELRAKIAERMAQAAQRYAPPKKAKCAPKKPAN